MARKLFVLTQDAQLDLKEIISYIANDNPRAARQVKAAIHSACRLLATYPGIGHRREDITPNPLRFWNVYGYQIIYAPATSPLHIIRILSHWRDIGHILRDMQ